MPFLKIVEFKIAQRKQSSQAIKPNKNNLPSTGRATSVKITSALYKSRSHTCLHAKRSKHNNSNNAWTTRLGNPCTNGHCSLRSPTRTHASLPPYRSPGISARASQHTSLPPTSKRVLVIEEVEDNMGSSKSKSPAPEVSDSACLLEKLSLNFADMEAYQQKLAQETSHTKAKKFVESWRHGLSYPRTKKTKRMGDIPIAATSHCKSGIKPWTRFYRRHVKKRLGRHSTDETLLADLVHKESLEKFIEETEQIHATSSIQIREDMKHKRLYDSVHHADSAKKITQAGEAIIHPIDDDDLQLTVQINVPPPVHIDYIPEKNLFEKELAKLNDLGIKKSGDIRHSLSFTHGKPLVVMRTRKNK